MLQLFTAGVPFLNARLQGLDRLYRAYYVGESPGGFDPAVAKRMMYARGAMLVAVSGFMAALNYDDEDFENMRDVIRWDNWRIPLPFQG